MTPASPALCKMDDFGPREDLFDRFVTDECGQDMIEYALVAATLGLGTVAGVNGLASSISRYMGIVVSGFDASLAGHV